MDFEGCVEHIVHDLVRPGAFEDITVTLTQQTCGQAPVPQSTLFVLRSPEHESLNIQQEQAQKG